MSDQNPSGTPESLASGDESGKKDAVSYDSHKKLLGEKKSLQDKARTLEERLAELEQEKLEADGKVKEAYENQKRLTKEMKDKNLSIIKKVGEKAIRSQFNNVSKEYGCIDPELAMKACDFSDIELTEDFEFDHKKLETKIQELQKAKPHLFKNAVKLPNDLIPLNGSSPQKSLSELSETELKNLLKNAK